MEIKISEQDREQFALFSFAGRFRATALNLKPNHVEIITCPIVGTVIMQKEPGVGITFYNESALFDTWGRLELSQEQWEELAEEEFDLDDPEVEEYIAKQWGGNE